MKIQIASDLHLEFLFGESTRPDPSKLWHLPKTEADVIVLAGDIWYHTHSLWWIAEEYKYQGKPIIFVFGNHDYWNQCKSNRHGLKTAVKVARAKTEAYRNAGAEIHFLENGEVVIGTTRFLGCTLWADYLGEHEHSIMLARKSMNDFIAIPGKPEPREFLALHKESVAWLDQKLAEAYPGETVVVTHHAPHPDSMDKYDWEGPRGQRAKLFDGSYFTDLSWLIDRHQPTLWVHGHTHLPLDYVFGATRLIHNPRGYNSDGKWVSGSIAAKVVEV